MNKITQFRPAFFDSSDPLNSSEFETTNQLLEVDFVKRFREVVGFDHFKLSDDMLLAIRNHGQDWLIVGRVENPEWADSYLLGGGMDAHP